MSRKQYLDVYVSDKAKVGLANISNYLQERFSDSVKIKYLESIDLAFDALAAMPEMGVKYTNGVRKFVWKKHTLIFYKYDALALLITNIEDARSNYQLRVF